MNVEYLVPIILEDILEFHADLEKSDIPVENGVRDMALLEAAVSIHLFKRLAVKTFSQLSAKKRLGFVMALPITMLLLMGINGRQFML